MNEIENIDSAFSYRQKVKIINGFYSGYTGIITSYIKNIYNVEIRVNEKTLIIACKREHIETAPKRKWYSFV